ncbi:MAG: winged helix-turn-helix transcriptional regulator [Burkholderiales bacterium]|nr:winged helix-turn-helix transcriptional regulator [Burkholderiales bacterium]
MNAPTSFVDDYLPALLAQASQLISGEFHDVVAKQGFTVSEWRVLATLADGKALSIGHLAQVTTMKQPTVTRVLDRMEARGQIERVPSDGDRRVTWVRITPLGARAVKLLIPLAREHEARILEPFGLERAEALKAMLRSIVELHRGAAAEADVADVADE